MSYCPRSSLPADVLAWLADRLAHLLPPRPPGRGGTPPLPLEVRLDAVAAVILDGLSYRRAGRAVGISKTEVGDSLDLLLGELAAIGYCQPDGTFITTLEELRRWLGEMARSGEAVCVDGLATRVQRPRSWANQKVVDDAKRHAHTAQGLSVTSTSSSSWRGWRGRWTRSRWPACWIGGSGAWPRVARTGTRRLGTAGPRTGSATGSGCSTACRLGCARWWSSRSAIWQAPGRCAAGAGCGTGSGTSSGPPARGLHRPVSARGGGPKVPTW